MLGEPVDNDPDNLISLSLADHFLVHYYYYLLAKKGFRQRMATAFTFMAKKCLKFMSPDTAEQMARDYEEARVISIQMISDANKGKTISEWHRQRIIETNTGRKPTDTQRQHISEALKGKPHPHRGHKLSDETKLKISISHTGMHPSEESRLKMSAVRKGKVLSEFGRLFKERYGITQSDDSVLYYREHKYYQRHGYLRPIEMNK